MINCSEIYNFFQEVPSSLITFFIGLLGITIGAFLSSWLTTQRDKSQRKYLFIQKQLTEFYSPMLGIRQEILTKSELREKLSSAANAAWQRYCSENSNRMDSNCTKNSDEKFKKFENIIHYDNENFRTNIIPTYNKMLDIFRENFWLSEKETRDHYAELVEFVEVWNRYLKESMPYEVIQEIGHTEEKLHPFYKHLEDTHNKLRKIVAKGKI